VDCPSSFIHGNGGSSIQWRAQLHHFRAEGRRAIAIDHRGPRLAIVASNLETPMSFQNQFSEIEAVRLHGAGHWLMLDEPAKVDAGIDSFLGKVP
jgi:pimeloyl-ACP methyl ester carboxylesterase